VPNTTPNNKICKKDLDWLHCCNFKIDHKLCEVMFHQRWFNQILDSYRFDWTLRFDLVTIRPLIGFNRTIEANFSKKKKLASMVESYHTRPNNMSFLVKISAKISWENLRQSSSVSSHELMRSRMISSKIIWDLAKINRRSLDHNISWYLDRVFDRGNKIFLKKYFY
jgi:hypothetical protein